MQRITVKEKDNTLEIVVLPFMDPFKQKVLATWILFWSFIGVYLIYELLFAAGARELKLYLLVWLAFWAYLEFKTVKAYRFRNNGMETIAVKEGKFIYVRQIGGRGLDQVFDTTWIQEIRKVDESPNSFFGFMSKSYWTLNNESLEMLYKGRSIRFGLDLNDQESQQIVGKIKSKIKNTA